MQRRPNLLPVLEKQSAILSRALSTCGDNVILIDRYMAVAEARYDTDATISLWSSVSSKEHQRLVWLLTLGVLVQVLVFPGPADDGEGFAHFGHFHRRVRHIFSNPSSRISGARTPSSE